MNLQRRLQTEINNLTQGLTFQKRIKLAAAKNMLMKTPLDYIDAKQLKLFDQAIRILDEADIARGKQAAF